MPLAWIHALIGGALIGLSATLLLIANGRIMGVSGIFFGIFKPASSQDFWWRCLFLLGLLGGGLLVAVFLEGPFENSLDRPFWMVLLAGFLVGYGTRLGSGCTSGHGVCGISRLSPRSILATVTFILAGVVTVAILSFFGF